MYRWARSSATFFTPLSASTSARRLQEVGPFRMGLSFAWLELRHFLGADPARLKGQYPDVR